MRFEMSPVPSTPLPISGSSAPPTDDGAILYPCVTPCSRIFHIRRLSRQRAGLAREFARTVQFIRGFRKDGRLLEIGCAYGFFLEEAGGFYDVAGIEIADAAVAFCRARGLFVINGVAEEFVLAQFGMLDVIVLLDVIEHLPDPQSTLALCRQHLNPGGVIVITTGDFASFYARLAGRNWRLMTPPQHLWFFTP